MYVLSAKNTCDDEGALGVVLLGRIQEIQLKNKSFMRKVFNVTVITK